ncbi:unnamed protein product [Saccharomyces cerevisiae]|nr:unnamed protein product [Saccharomyces cerevisiae]GMC44601.1 unnamed protein product [Saccharomyces cerevisiae]
MLNPQQGQPYITQPTVIQAHQLQPFSTQAMEHPQSSQLPPQQQQLQSVQHPQQLQGQPQAQAPQPLIQHNVEQNVLPQKRYMEGAIHTLVDAAVSSSTHTENNTKSPRQPTHAIPTQAPATGITNAEPQVKKQKLNSPNSNINKLVNTATSIEENAKSEVSNQSPAVVESNTNNTSQEEKPVKANSIPSVIGAQEPPQEASLAEEATKAASVSPSTKPLNTEPESSSVQPTVSSESSTTKANDQSTAETIELSTATVPAEASPVEDEVRQHSKEENGTTEASAPSTEEAEPAASRDAEKQQDETAATTITVIKPTLETMETVKEEAKMREEEQTSQEKSPQENTLPRENVVRQVEEDENYDD